MRWDKVRNDSYYEARKQEYMAKRLESFGDWRHAIECWQRYSDIKLEKGSYFLAYFGYRQVIRLSDANGEKNSSQNARRMIEKLEKEDYPEVHDLFYVPLRYEIDGNIRDSITAYEELGDLFKERKNYFLAADAYEHAAEGRHKMGLPVKDYGLPHEAWGMNSKYWTEQGEEDDSKWSEERKDYYDKLYRK